jgi:protein-S-isoprenylcysteine O-methyltransferase Ste14
VSRIPDLGPRGEGWFAGQVLLLGTIGVLALTGPAWDGPVRLVTAVAGVLLMVAGAFLALRGIVDLRSSLTPLPAPAADAVLVETGIYAHVRHPIYAGLISGAFGWSLAWAAPLALAAAVGLAIWLDLKSRREELWLGERYPGYAAYRGRTRRFVPRLY